MDTCVTRNEKPGLPGQPGFSLLPMHAHDIAASMVVAIK
jgi:hypothetical protein